MRKNRTKHEAKKPRLAKRALALCFALIFVCSCLLPAFANSEAGALSGTQETVVEQQQDEQQPTEPVLLNEGSEDSAVDNTDSTGSGTNPTEEPKPAEQEPKADEPKNEEPKTEEPKTEGTTESKESTEQQGNEQTKPEEPKTEGTTESKDSTEEQPKNEGTTGETKPEETKPEGTTEEPKTEETKPEEPKQPTTNTTGDTIEQGKATYTYRFWPDKIDAFELEAINDAVKSGTSLNDAAQSQAGMVPCTVLTVMTNANLRDYQANVQQPTKSGYEFAGWYTVDGTTEDEFSFEQNLNFEESKTIDVFAKWNELVTLRATTTVDVDATLFGGEAAISLADEYSYEDDRVAAPTKTLTLDVEATNLSSNSELSVSSASSSAIEDYCDNNELMPILTLDITPKDKVSDKKTEPQGTSTVTIRGLSGLELPNKLTMVHKKDNGEIEEIPAQYSNGTLTFEATSFSTYAVAAAATMVASSTSNDPNNVLFHILTSPTVWPGYNDSGYWYYIGRGKVDVEGASWEVSRDETGIKNTFDNVDNRITLWPTTVKKNTDGEWVLNDTTARNKVVESYKTVLKEKYGIDILAKDISEIVVKPYKISKNNWDSHAEPSTLHVDCTIEVRVKGVINATYNVWEPETTGYQMKETHTYKLVNGEAQTQPNGVYAPEKVVGGKTYRFEGWYYDKERTIPADFSSGYCTITANTDFYAKYVDVTTNVLEDMPYIKVEKRFSGISLDDIPYNFRIEVGSKKLLKNSATITYEDDGTIVLTWEIENVTQDRYYVKEYNESVGGYTVKTTGDDGTTVDVKEKNTFVAHPDRITQKSQQDFKIGEHDGQNWVFVVSLTNNKNLVLSKDTLSVREREAVAAAIKDYQQGPFKNQPNVFYSIKNNAEVTIDGHHITYSDSNAYVNGAGIHIDYMDSWNQVLGVHYSTTETQNPEISITNTYTPNTLDIQITKKVDFGDKTKDFKFKVTSDNFSTTNNVSLINRGGTSQRPQEWFYLKDSESATLKGLKKDYIFTIEEEKENSADYDTTATENIAVEAGKTKSFRYKVVEEDGELVLQAVDEETGVAVAGKNLITNGRVVVTNSAAATSLTVTKKVESSGNAAAPANAEFTFRLTVSDDVKVYSKVKLTKDGNDITKSSVQSNKYQWEFTLKNDESVHISGIRLDDSSVKVEEVISDNHYTTKHKVNDEAEGDGKEATFSTLKQNSNTVVFTNTYSVPNLSSMTIKKVVTGAFGERTKEFAFSVTLENADCSTAGVEISKGTLNSFTLKHGEEVSLKDIPVGTTITVTETGADEYETKATNYKNYIKTGDRTFTYTVEEQNGTAVLKSKDNNQTVADNAIVVTNDYDGNPDTGVLLDTLPYLILLAVAVAGGVLVVVRKRKHRDE